MTVNESYLDVWNESDAGRRRELIEQLWAQDAVMLLEPPEEIREKAQWLGVHPVLEVRGHDALEIRVTRAYEEFVASGQMVFKLRHPPARLGDVVTLSWDAVNPADGQVVGGGLDVFTVGADGRIMLGHQFIGR